ncbi:MAG: tetratricopeptide repeat protein [Burkholderiales bacterium]|nr:tetratricopeptide repeat protein [Burkholderiales bacterium]
MFFPAHRVIAALSSVRGIAVCAALVVVCAGCTPQQMLVSALVPDGTASVLLGHLEGMADGNRTRIVELEKQGDWRGLADFAAGNMARDPFSAEWRFVAGYAQARLGDYRAASEHFGEMVRLAPDDPAAYRFLAEAQRAGGEPRRAVLTLERALRVSADSPLTLSLLGDAYGDLGRDAEALAAYRKALALAPQLETAWWGYGRTALRSGRAEDAREAARALRGLGSPRGAELERMMAEAGR